MPGRRSDVVVTSTAFADDFLGRYRTDFMDIYLCAKARFFMGTLSGLMNIPQIFDVPFGVSNNFPCAYVTSGKNVLYARMLLRERKTGQILSFPEMKRRGLLQCSAERIVEFLSQEFWDNLGFDIVPNDAQDIDVWARGLRCDMRF